MKLNIKIEYRSGESAVYAAGPSEWAKWERDQKTSIQKVEDTLGIYDLLFLAYNAMKREKAGQPVKPFEVWMDTVEDVGTEKTESPKVTPSEA